MFDITLISFIIYDSYPTYIVPTLDFLIASVSSVLPLLYPMHAYTVNHVRGRYVVIDQAEGVPRMNREFESIS